MATFADTGSSQVPATPSKGDTDGRAQEVAPEYSPGAVPAYDSNHESANVFGGSGSGKAYDGSVPININSINRPYVGHHPIYPKGDHLRDVQTHLQCEHIFGNNIREFISQFKEMAQHLEESRKEVRKTKGELWLERNEKEKLYAECSDLRELLRDIETELDQSRTDLKLSERRLTQAIEELRRTVGKLEQARKELKQVIRQRDDWKRIAEKHEQDALYHEKRAVQLQLALDAANRREKAALERENRLMETLYQIGQEKARSEELRRDWESRARIAEDEAGRVRKDVRDLNTEIGRLRGKIRELEGTRVTRSYEPVHFPVFKRGHGFLTSVGMTAMDDEDRHLEREEDHESSQQVRTMEGDNDRAALNSELPAPEAATTDIKTDTTDEAIAQSGETTAQAEEATSS